MSVVHAAPDHAELEQPHGLLRIRRNDLHGAASVRRDGLIGGVEIDAEQRLDGEGAVRAGETQGGVVTGAVHQRQRAQVGVAARNAVGIGGERGGRPGVVGTGSFAEVREGHVPERGAVANGGKGDASRNGVGAVRCGQRFIELPQVQGVSIGDVRRRGGGRKSGLEARNHEQER